MEKSSFALESGVAAEKVPEPIFVATAVAPVMVIETVVGELFPPPAELPPEPLPQPAINPAINTRAAKQNIAEGNANPCHANLFQAPVHPLNPLFRLLGVLRSQLR